MRQGTPHGLLVVVVKAADVGMIAAEHEKMDRGRLRALEAKPANQLVVAILREPRQHDINPAIAFIH